MNAEKWPILYTPKCTTNIPSDLSDSWVWKQLQKNIQIFVECELFARNPKNEQKKQTYFEDDKYETRRVFVWFHVCFLKRETRHHAHRERDTFIVKFQLLKLNNFSLLFNLNLSLVYRVCLCVYYIEMCNRYMNIS